MVQTHSIEKNKILIICGPTASGKTALAVECAKLLNSEVVSADSMYIYRDLNIGTAKPAKDEMQGIKHHLIDVVNADEKFSVSDYKSKAEPIIKDIISKNKIPVICGGTGFYINSILYDLSYGGSSANLEAREKYFSLAKEKGNEYVYNILLEKDVESAKKLHFNDVKRVIRALEIFESGNKKSDFNDKLIPKYNYRAYCINHTRDTLYERINKRVDLMIEKGLCSEVENLLRNGVSSTNQCMQAIGYKEIIQYLSKERTLNDTIELIKLNTRHYAKRQITFFKKMNNLKYLEALDVKLLAQRIIKEL